MKRVYISGPMTGFPDNNRLAFQHAEYKLARLGFCPVNPHHVPPFINEPTKIPTYVDHMKADIRELLKCEMIYMLTNWENSIGAQLENHIAKVIGIEELRLEIVDLK